MDRYSELYFYRDDYKNFAREIIPLKDFQLESILLKNIREASPYSQLP